MDIILNGERRTVASATLKDLLAELGHAERSVATAINRDFVSRGERAGVVLRDGDAVEILAPMQGG